uniref:Uncharacterized protein n=1 Tax=Solanum tuberosum TaxID=4113 RepID=M1DZ04_SOLTU
MCDEYVDKGRLLEEFPHIHAQVRALGLHYIFVDQGKCNMSLVREFYVNWNTHHVRWNQGLICNNRVQFLVEALNEFLAAPYCDHSGFQAMIDQPPYHHIRHTLCRVNSVSSLITRYLHALEIEEEFHNVFPPHAPYLVYCLVDVTRTKAHDQSQGKLLSTVDRQARDDSWMGRMFRMAKLQLRIGGRPVTEDEIETSIECYLLMDSAMYMCRMGPTFQEPLDDDDTTTDEEDGSEEDDSDDVGLGDDDMDADDGAGDAASMAVDFFMNVATC